ncbi:hypothetical protein DV737_g3689, partial [Chaetothyriales sp. CBS 132003]
MPDLNPFLLAAAVPTPDPRLLPLLRSKPWLASQQDEHGYSLLHAAASYNHIDLLRTLVSEFNVDVGLKDEDGETALFVAETVEACKCLVEELGADPAVKNDEGLTAREKVEHEAEYPEVAEYLRARDRSQGGGRGSATTPLPPLPAHISMTVNTVNTADTADGVGAEGQEPDPEFRRRIEELAGRDDFQTEEGQRQLRELITDAIRGVGNDREVRRRVEE